ncbi:metallophosphoesterase family protein [Lactiplantibacillus pentosus]|uniref:metallophosphoesterase family protein n=1 Tax=Lactiplantibacillus pentosus TaxID=1589 RepID=UPI001CD21049|nr:metallophosphoesterase family protein [Lactiplantibacillus pentosus]MCJ8184827.1 metallophosphoesterase [Lactiplantibacillus pentosus]
MVKIAVLSDVHGNATALEAVLADARAQQVDEYWTVGDMTVRGPESERVLSLLDTRRSHRLRPRQSRRKLPKSPDGKSKHLHET